MLVYCHMDIYTHHRDMLYVAKPQLTLSYGASLPRLCALGGPALRHMQGMALQVMQAHCKAT